MCDPITLGLAALSGGAALFGSSNKSPPPPPPVVPVAPTTAQTPNATVKVGDGAKPEDTTTSTPQYDGFTTKRTFGTPLGGLGRGGLGL